jgi:hypothetical protein
MLARSLEKRLRPLTACRSLSRSRTQAPDVALLSEKRSSTRRGNGTVTRNLVTLMALHGTSSRPDGEMVGETPRRGLLHTPRLGTERMAELPPPPRAPVAPGTNKKAIWALVCGIVGIWPFFFICSSPR